MDAFVYCLLLSQHHKLLALNFLSLGLGYQQITAAVPVRVSNKIKRQRDDEKTDVKSRFCICSHFKRAQVELFGVSAHSAHNATVLLFCILQ